MSRNIMIILLIFCLFISLMFMVLPLLANASGNIYYVDAIKGNDENTGTSPKSPWKSLNKVNTTLFQPGDKILLKAGSIWSGRLFPRGSGSEGHPIVIDMYGSGNKPMINAEGRYESAFYLLNQSYWEVNNLELTNKYDKQANLLGVKIEAQNAGIINHIHLKNLYVHDVTGIIDEMDNRAKDTGGIGFMVTENRVNTRFNNIIIEGCEIYRVDNTGIFTQGVNYTTTQPGSTIPEPNGKTWDDLKITGLLIQNNVIHDIGKNAIIIRLDHQGLVQNNVVYDTAFRANSGNQIFTRSCYGTVIQFNEGFLNRARVDRDGSAYDADYYSPHTIWQYNYSHDNAFGLITFCTKPTDDNIIVRYNISQNDKGRLLNFNYNFSKVLVYNNIFYIPQHLSPVIIYEEYRKGGSNYISSQDYEFYNNIIYNLSPTAAYRLNPNLRRPDDKYNGRKTKRRIENNCFYGMHPENEPSVTKFGDGNNIFLDPQFVNPGSGRVGRGTLNGYKLKLTSPCINRGKNISNNGGIDFWGNPLYYGEQADIGAFEYQGEDTGPKVDFNSYPPIFNSTMPAVGADCSKNFIEIVAAEDAYVKESSADKNYGFEEFLNIKGSASGFRQHSFIKFDLSNYLMEIDDQQLIKLRLYVSRVEGTPTHPDGYKIAINAFDNTDWEEEHITYKNSTEKNTMLPDMVELGIIEIPQILDSALIKSEYFEVDVTSYIKSKIGEGITIFSFVLKDKNNPEKGAKYLSFYSKDNATSLELAPRLIVE